MLLTQSDLLLDDPFAFFVLLVAVGISLLIGISFHEAAHAYSANALGDSTAARLGRITLNPKAHLDPTGTVMLLIAGFGWGKPVPVNPFRLRSRNSMAIVSAAGPLANLMLAISFAMLFQFGILEAGGFTREELRTVSPTAWLNLIGAYGVSLNLILAAFNLLPLPPLDGGGILSGIAPERWLPAVDALQRVGPILLIGVIGISFLTPISPLGFIFGPVLDLAHVLVSG